MLPDAAGRARLAEQKSALFAEKYADYLALGIEEWKKSYAEHEKLGKKAVLFVMVDDTRNCDEVGTYLEKIYPEPLVVEVDGENRDKDLETLDIAIPRLSRRYSRDFNSLEDLDPSAFGNQAGWERNPARDLAGLVAEFRASSEACVLLSKQQQSLLWQQQMPSSP